MSRSARACLGCRDCCFDHCLAYLSSRHIYHLANTEICSCWAQSPNKSTRSHREGRIGGSEQNEEPSWHLWLLSSINPPLLCTSLVGNTSDTHKSLSGSFQLGQEMTHVGRQWLISVYPREVEPVRVYLTGQALKWRSNKPVKWYYHRNMIDQLNSIRDSGQWD